MNANTPHWPATSKPPHFPSWQVGIACLATSAVLIASMAGFVQVYAPLWQSPEGNVRIVYLAPGRASIKEQGLRIEQALRQRTGVNVKVEFQASSNDMKARAEQVRQIAQSRPLVLLTAHPDMAKLIVDENIDLQVVTGTRANPHAQGFRKAGLARQPNVSGLSTFTDLEEKRLAMLKEVAPKVRRIGVMLDASIAAERKFLNDGRLSYRVDGAEVVPVLVETLDDALTAVRNSASMGFDAWYVRDVPAYYLPPEITRLVGAINTQRLPAIYERMAFVDAGGLLAYEPALLRLEELWIRTLQLLVEGAAARDIPFNRPHHFFLTYNVETAHQLGITPGVDFLSRIDQIYPCAVRSPMNCKHHALR